MEAILYDGSPTLLRLLRQSIWKPNVTKILKPEQPRGGTELQSEEGLTDE